MANASEPIAAPQATDAVVGRQASGFVDHHKAERAAHIRWSVVTSTVAPGRMRQ
jgi:hypothetical protein